MYRHDLSSPERLTVKTCRKAGIQKEGSLRGKGIVRCRIQSGCNPDKEFPFSLHSSLPTNTQQYRVPCFHPTIPCTCAPCAKPLAFSFRSSPRTSALAVGERERPSGPRPADTERTPTHTHCFPAPRNQLDVPSLFPGFSLWPPEPQVPATGSPGWRGFENHRPKTDHTYKTPPFPVLLRVLRVTGGTESVLPVPAWPGLPER